MKTVVTTSSRGQIHWGAAALPALVCLTFIGLAAPASLALAQGQAAQTTPAPALDKRETPKVAIPKPSEVSKPAPITQPNWADLTPTQHKALKPLAAQWAQLGVESKRKWLAISKNYDSLPPVEQAKMHSRMSEWVSLSQQQRTEARLNFAESKKLPADEKAAHWQSYQGLSPEAKRKLAAQAPAKPNGVAVVKPIPEKKLADVTVAPHTPQQGAKLAGSHQAVNPNTLLPQRSAPAETTSPQK